jgi:hypothetical protein
VVSTLARLVERSLLEVRAADQHDQDHVAVVGRRQQLLERLEDLPPAPAAPSDGADSGSDDGPPAARSGDDPVQSAPRRDGSGAPDVDQLVGAAAEGASMLGGAHVPGDVVPPRDEPFLPKRQPEYAERRQAAAGRVPAGAGGRGLGETVGATALEAQHSLIERDPSVNRSLMLRLIAGVRGL